LDIFDFAVTYRNIFLIRKYVKSYVDYKSEKFTETLSKVTDKKLITIILTILSRYGIIFITWKYMEQEVIPRNKYIRFEHLPSFAIKLLESGADEKLQIIKRIDFFTRFV